MKGNVEAKAVNHCTEAFQRRDILSLRLSDVISSCLSHGPSGENKAKLIKLSSGNKE